MRLIDAVFEKDGKQIPYRKASLTRDGGAIEEIADLALSIRETGPVQSMPAKRVRKDRAKKPKRPAPTEDRSNSGAEEQLRAWRIALAKKQGVPAFRIMTDRVLLAIAESNPRNAAELIAIPGMGLSVGRKIWRAHLSHTRMAQPLRGSSSLVLARRVP